MRFKVIDKILLSILLLLIAALAVGLFGIATKLVTKGMLDIGVSVIIYEKNALILAGVGFVLLIFVIRLFVAMGKKRDAAGSAAKQPTSALLLEGEGGTAYITLAAIDAMVQRHCRGNGKVKECESAVSLVEAGITVNLKLSVLNETIVPELVTDLQKSLREYVETLSGIRVREVNILIVHMPAPAKPRPQ